MPFKKNTSGNPKGKPKGTPNKITSLQKEFIQNLLDNQTNKIEMEINKLEGKDYLSVILDLIEYTLPKLSRKSIDNSDLFKGADELFFEE